MTIEILFFGQLTDKTGCSSMHLDNPGSIDLLKEQLFQKFPELKNAKFTIAINNRLIIKDQIILENSTIAFMPPFSGG